MTNKERMKSLFLGKPIDRVPFLPFFVGYLAVNSGISLYDFYSKPDLAFKTGMEVMKRYPWANIRPVYGWIDNGAWIFGGKTAWPIKEGTMAPYTPEPLIDKVDDVGQMLETEPLNTEWFRLRDRFNGICIQHGFQAHLPAGSVMVQLGSILGATNLLKWVVRHPDALKRLAEKVCRFNMKAALLTIEKYGPKNCGIMTELPLESNSIISSEVFKEFCLPYIMELHGFYLESGVRATIIHLCGDHRDNLKYWKEVPLPERTIFSISDRMDLQETGDFLGEKFILAGNLSTTTLQFGTKEDVKAEVKRCLTQAKSRPGGYILMPACEYPPMAPVESLEAIREALMDDGFY
jgi:uroporphyrinogen decarboxylase